MTNRDLWLSQNLKFFPDMMKGKIQQDVQNMSDEKFAIICSIDYKNPTTILICAFFVIDRFLLEDVGMGVLKFLTGGGCGIWWIIDMINAQTRTKNYNFKKYTEALMLSN